MRFCDIISDIKRTVFGRLFSFCPGFAGAFLFHGGYMSGRRDGLQRAKNVKNDEFYTRYSDIAAECDHYLDQFRGKTIYCNCDTAGSNFVRYFQNLKIRGLIKDVLWSGGLGGLDFRSPDALDLLRTADVVVTNPPFSLFREYVALLMDYGKKFLILGNQNAVSYKDFFPLFISGQVRLGYKAFSAMLFDVPVVEPDKSYKIVDGRPMAAIGVAWFTNLDVDSKPGVRLHKFYCGNQEKYPKYDNYDAINIDRVSDIPMDYSGVMGVPISFLAKHDPKQFVLLGLDESLTVNNDRCTIDGKRLYARIFICKNNMVIADNDNENLTDLAA